MNKACLVARNEYFGTVRTKAFWLGLLAFPLIIGLAVFVPWLLHKAKDVRTYAVIDGSGFLLNAVDALIYEADLNDLLQVTSQRKRDGGGEFEQLPLILRELTSAWLEIDERQRREFVGVLVDSGGSDVSHLGRFGASKKEDLRAWWRAVSRDDLQTLDIDLSKTRFVRTGAGAELSDLNARINSGELFAYLLIGPDPVSDSQGCKYISNNLTDRALLDWFAAKANTVIREHRVAHGNVESDVAAWIVRPLLFEDRKVGAYGAEEEVEPEDKARQWAPAGFTYLLFIAIFTSAQMLLTSTIEEKSARIMELLLAAVSPVQLMAGKIAGVAGAGLTVVASWAFFITLTVLIVPTVSGSSAAIKVLSGIASNPLFLLSFVIYFVLGYLLYATFLVGVGSVCNNLKDAQNLVLPMMIPMLVAIFSLIPISQDPNGLLARVMSFIPPFTPFVMMNRAAGPPAMWEYAATTVVLVVAIYVALIAAAKVFRIGILMTGKPPKIREIARWLTVRVGEMPPSGDTELLTGRD